MNRITLHYRIDGKRRQVTFFERSERSQYYPATYGSVAPRLMPVYIKGFRRLRTAAQLDSMQRMLVQYVGTSPKKIVLTYPDGSRLTMNPGFYGGIGAITQATWTPVRHRRTHRLMGVLVEAEIVIWLPLSVQPTYTPGPVTPPVHANCRCEVPATWTMNPEPKPEQPMSLDDLRKITHDGLAEADGVRKAVFNAEGGFSQN